MRAAFVLGRLVFGAYFVYNGINHFRNLKGMAGYAASKNIPLPEVGVAASGGLLVAGGASLALGVNPKYGAAALVAFLAGVSPVMHDFWHNPDPQQSQNDMIHFAKNMALLGAAIALGAARPLREALIEGGPKMPDDNDLPVAEFI